MLVVSDRLAALRSGLSSPNIAQNLRFLVEQFPGQVSFSTSFGLEDQAITHLIFENELPIRVFTLDTGRLFPETYSTWSATLDRYPGRIETFSPEAGALQDFLSQKGPNAFYESVDNRQACCHIRKIEPLRRALQGQAIWVTGIRAEQSPNRQHMS
ncbi:MAG: phosphoadenosine phosphosulfate reductase family protein, partial [Saprospiraceae bacterium]|nr:phosphoadenosine phosphosulfate reductase family protein [Saprospiraceae bacterium]